MWRYFVGAAGALLLAVAAMFLFRGSAASTPKALLPGVPASAAAGDDPLPDAAPRASDKTREQKRFDRIDKDRNDSITRDEYFVSRHKAFAKLDLDHDGKLSFDEWGAKALKKFGDADADKSGALTRAEFATTAVKRKSSAPRCACAPAKVEARPEGDGAAEE